MNKRNGLHLTLNPNIGRISIGQNALKALGMPESVLLLVSPEEAAVFLTENGEQDPRGMKVKQDSKGTMRVYSQALCKAILSLLPGWDGQMAICLKGTRTEEGIQFPLAVPAKGGIPT